MRKFIALLLTVLTFTLFFDNISIAVDKKSTKKAKNITHAVDTSSVIPFDMNTEKLPSNYKGTDIARLYDLLLKKAPLKKGEFETTTEYEKKVANAVTGDVYAFKIKKSSGLEGLKIYPYDADAQKLKIELNTECASGHFRASFIIKELDRGSDSYIGSNAFGAKRLVKHYRTTEYGIALVNQREFGSSGYDESTISTPLKSCRNVTIDIDIMPDKAKKLKDNIGVLLLCQPSLYRDYHERGNDLFFEESGYSGATLDLPVAVSYDRKYINVEILAIWVYDIRTGDILFKKQLKSSNNETM